MDSRTLAGHAILIVEDEPIISLDLVSAFEDAGAIVSTATTIDDAIRMVEQSGLSAAILDFGHDSNALCARLRERGIPFVLHSGYGNTEDDCEGGVVMPKPAGSGALIETVVRMLPTPIAR